MFSALPPNSDVARCGRHFAFVHTTDSRSAANKFDHSITSSTRAERVGGIVNPSALAVFRLMTSSTLVLCWIGKSAGLAPLRRVRGKVEFDGQERLSSQTLLDMLEVPQRSRTAGTYRRVAKLMAELGWTAVRVRDLTRGGYKEQVRGYVRTDTDQRPGRRGS
jgi:hypothetical protein